MITQATPPAVKRAAVLTAAAGLSTWAIDMAATQVGLVSQQAALGVSVTASQWILNLTLMIVAGLVTVGGALGDRAGRLRMSVWASSSLPWARWSPSQPDSPTCSLASSSAVRWKGWVQPWSKSRGTEPTGETIRDGRDAQDAGQAVLIPPDPAEGVCPHRRRGKRGRAVQVKKP